MFDHQCLRNDGSRPTRSQQSGQTRQKMHEEHQKVTHGARSYRYRLSLQVYEMRAICRDNRNSPGTPQGSPQRALPLLHRSYGPMRQTTNLRTPRLSLARSVFAGCRKPLLVTGPSRHYLCHLCGGARTHTPPCPPGALTHFFPDDSGLTPRETRSAHEFTPAWRLPQGAYFRGCSHSITFGLPHSLDPQIAPTAVIRPGGRAVYATHRPGSYLAQDVVSLRA